MGFEVQFANTNSYKRQIAAAFRKGKTQAYENGFDGEMLVPKPSDLGFKVDGKNISELVKMDHNLLHSSSFKGQSLQHILSEKESKKRKSAPKIKTKSRQQPPMEVDLHIEKLVKSKKGLDNYDILSIQLDVAKRKVEYCIEKKISKIIHEGL